MKLKLKASALALAAVLAAPQAQAWSLEEAAKPYAGTVVDVVFLDGHGVVHERGLGLASHIGVLLDVPTIGVPKTPFHAVTREPGQSRGDRIILTKEWGAAGAAVRLKARSKPVYVSPGHRVDLDSAIQIALEWTSGRHRVPEPLARAHTYSVLARNDGEAR